MKDCYYSKKNKVVRWLLLILGVVFGGTSITFGLFIILAYRLEARIIIPCGLLMIAVGICLAIECTLQYWLLNRKYKVDSMGLYVQHTRNNKQFYSWHQMQEVCLCNIHQGSHEGIYDTVIWCVVGTIKEDPPNIKRHRNNPYYGIRHFRSLITIEYSEERFSEFKRFYGGSNSDYR